MPVNVEFALRRLAAMLALGATLAGGLARAANTPPTTPPPTTPDPAAHMNKLIDDLGKLELSGPTAGGPYYGLQANAATKAVVAEGHAIVPPLVDRLAKTNDDHLASWIVFCLRELRAKEAKPAIADLQSALAAKKRFTGAPRTLTLDMQVKFFLRDVDSWK